MYMYIYIYIYIYIYVIIIIVRLYITHTRVRDAGRVHRLGEEYLFKGTYSLGPGRAPPGNCDYCNNGGCET